MDDRSRLKNLQTKVRIAYNSPSHSGVRGLRLSLPFLKVRGATADFLHLWNHGRPLGASPAAPSRLRNHPSLTQYADLASQEWPEEIRRACNASSER